MVGSGSSLEVQDLTVRLGPRTVLADLSLSVAAGECVGLIGPNGAGKSTLLRAIMGLTRAAGTVRLGDGDVVAMDERARARAIAYLPQETHVAWPLTVAALVMLGRAPFRSGFAPPTEADHAAVEAALAVMDLHHLRDRSVLALSGGERSRVLIARALAQDTHVLLADEPTTGLDPAHQIALMETFRALVGRGRSVLVSLHDLALAAQWCDRLVLMDRGAVVASGRPDEVLTPDTLAAVYGVRAHFGESSRGLVIVPTGRV